MARLTPDARKALPKREFAGPGRTYPVPDRKHARAALMDSGIAARKGRISTATKNRIQAKARKVLRQGRKPKR